MIGTNQRLIGESFWGFNKKNIPLNDQLWIPLEIKISNYINNSWKPNASFI